MPNPNQVDLSDAPGTELDLNDIFTNPELQPTTTGPSSTEPSDPATTQEADPFLKTATGTVYKTVEDAVQGVEHKDALIAQLRHQLADQTGKDPLKKDSQPTGPTNYLQDKEGYFKDLSKAVEAKDQEAYLNVQRKFVYDSLAPLTPTLTLLVKEQAANNVEAEVKGFRQFVSSEDYTNTLESFPLLKQAITVAENSPEAASQLPEFYKMAYYASQGVRLPQLVQASANRSTEPVRPTVTSTPTAPANSGTRTVAPNLTTSEGRKAIIEAQERLGVANLRM